jgi:hypothetical protein
MRQLENKLLRSLTLLVMVVAVGCVLLPDIDSFSWEQSYSKSHSPVKGTFLSALFDTSAEEDTDGDGVTKLWHGTFSGCYGFLQSPVTRQVPVSSFASFQSTNLKYFILHRKLLL